MRDFPRLLAAIGLGFAASLVAGCIPVALPPLGLVAGGGVGTRKAGGAEGIGSFEVTARPLAAVGSMRERRLDFGAGVAIETAPDFTRTGPSADIRGFPLIGAISETALARLGLGMQARVLFDESNGHAGPSASFYATGELVPWVDGMCETASGSKSVLFGCYYGEAAIGLRVQGSYGVYADTPIWSLTFGLEFRSPALLGILFFWPGK